MDTIDFDAGPPDQYTPTPSPEPKLGKKNKSLLQNQMEVDKKDESESGITPVQEKAFASMSQFAGNV